MTDSWSIRRAIARMFPLRSTPIPLSGTMSWCAFRLYNLYGINNWEHRSNVDLFCRFQLCTWATTGRFGYVRTMLYSCKSAFLNSGIHHEISDTKVLFLHLVLMSESGWSLSGDRWSTRTCTLQFAFVPLETIWQLAAGAVVQVPRWIGVVQKHSDCWMRDYWGPKVRAETVLSGIQPG